MATGASSSRFRCEAPPHLTCKRNGIPDGDWGVVITIPMWSASAAPERLRRPLGPLRRLLSVEQVLEVGDRQAFHRCRDQVGVAQILMECDRAGNGDDP